MRQIRIIIAAFMMVSPFAANADSISYDYTGTGEDSTGAEWTIQGSFIFDDASLVSGVDIIADLLSWRVSWTNGVDEFSNSDADSFFDRAEFFLLPDLSVDADFTFLCSNECNQGFEEVFRIFEGDSWVATINDSPLDDCCAEGEGEWSGPNSVSVPEPSTLALLGVGLVGIGLARRRRQA